MLHTAAKVDRCKGRDKDYKNNNTEINNNNNNKHIYSPAKEDGYEGHNNEAAIGNDHSFLCRRHLIILNNGLNRHFDKYWSE